MKYRENLWTIRSAKDSLYRTSWNRTSIGILSFGEEKQKGWEKDRRGNEAWKLLNTNRWEEAYQGNLSDLISISCYRPYYRFSSCFTEQSQSLFGGTRILLSSQAKLIGILWHHCRQKTGFSLSVIRVLSPFADSPYGSPFCAITKSRKKYFVCRMQTKRSERKHIYLTNVRVKRHSSKESCRSNWSR